MAKPLTAADFQGDEFFTESVTIGMAVLDAIKTPIKESLDVLASLGESYAAWEFVFSVADLIANGLASPLPDGTKIVDANGVTYQAMPFKNQPHYRWVDAERTQVGVRCKEVGA